MMARGSNIGGADDKETLQRTEEKLLKQMSMDCQLRMSEMRTKLLLLMSE